MPAVQNIMHTLAALLFFLVAVAASYVAPDRAYMGHFAVASFCFFLALGPIRWFGSLLDVAIAWVVFEFTAEDAYSKPDSEVVPWFTKGGGALAIIIGLFILLRGIAQAT